MSLWHRTQIIWQCNHLCVNFLSINLEQPNILCLLSKCKHEDARLICRSLCSTFIKQLKLLSKTYFIRHEHWVVHKVPPITFNVILHVSAHVTKTLSKCNMHELPLPLQTFHLTLTAHENIFTFCGRKRRFVHNIAFRVKH